MVELDTVVHEKKLWLSEKKVISAPFVSKHPRIAVQDSIVYVVYTMTDSTGTIQSTWSLDFGSTFSESRLIQRTVYGVNPDLAIHGNLVCLTYVASVPGNSQYREALYRKTAIGDLIMGDSIIIKATDWHNDSTLGYCQVLEFNGSLYASYWFHHYYYGRSVRYQTSIDSGTTWLPTNGYVDSAWYPRYLVCTDTVLLEVCDVDLDVGLSRSLDRGETWSPITNLSLNGYPSQMPAVAADGVASAHVGWYDFENGYGSNVWSGTIFYRNSHDHGQSWSDVSALSPGPDSEQIKLWADSQRVYAVWEDDRYGSPNLALYLRYSHDQGDSWSPEYKVVSETDPAWDPQIRTWGNNFYMVWREQHPPDWLWVIGYIFGVWYVPGDADNSGGVDVSDLSYIVDYLFRSGEPSWVPDAAQMNGADGVDVSDLTYFVDYLFAGGEPPVGGEPGL